MYFLYQPRGTRGAPGKILRHCLLSLILLFSLPLWADDFDLVRDAINAMQYDQAIEMLNKHLAQHADDRRARRMLARAYRWNNQYAQAVRQYDILLKDDNTNPQYLLGKAKSLAWLEKTEAALAVYKKLWQLQQTDPDVLRSYLLLLRESKQPQQQKLFHELSRQAPKLFPQQHWDLIIE